VSRRQWRGAKPRGKTRLSGKRLAGSQSYKKTWNVLKLGMLLADDASPELSESQCNMAGCPLSMQLPSWNALQQMPELSDALSVYISRQTAA